MRPDRAHRAALYMKDSLNHMKDSVNRVENVSQREGHLARLWIDFETLLLRERVGYQ